MQAAPPHRVARRLAAILAADVVGDSRLMGQDKGEQCVKNTLGRRGCGTGPAHSQMTD